MNTKRLWLRQYRESQNLSREKLAEKLNTSDQLIYQWEAGIRNPSKDNRIALARVLGEIVLLKFVQEELEILQNGITAA